MATLVLTKYSAYFFRRKRNYCYQSHTNKMHSESTLRSLFLIIKTHPLRKVMSNFNSFQSDKNKNTLLECCLDICCRKILSNFFASTFSVCFVNFFFFWSLERAIDKLKELKTVLILLGTCQKSHEK